MNRPSAPAPDVRAEGRLAAFIGRRADWVPSLGNPVRASHLGGPLAILATFLVSAVPFVGADGDGLGLYVGTASILAMAWTFLLSVRARPAERVFGGLDRVYVAHRWCGIVAIVLMWWHVQSGNQLERGAVPGASEQLAETGTDLGGIAEFWLYALVIASILRVLPWRIWRWTHKLMIVPYAFASFHMLTADKPFSNFSAWGLWFAGVIAVGICSYMVQALGLRPRRRGAPHTVVAVVAHPRSVEVRLRPDRAPLRRRAGQFAFLRLRLPGAGEPHPFSIASAADDDELTFLVRELGDWTSGLASTVRAGDRVDVDGPYGRLRLRPRSARPIVWIAGGVGITPFLSDLAGTEDGPPPILLYAVRSREEAHAADRLARAADEGRVDVRYFESRQGERLTPETLRAQLGDHLRGAHVVVCGPVSMVRWVRRTARRGGARTVESEEFDLRGGVGPDPSLATMPRLRRR